MDNTNIDILIASYSDELLKMKEKWQGMGVVTAKEDEILTRNMPSKDETDEETDTKEAEEETESAKAQINEDESAKLFEVKEDLPMQSFNQTPEKQENTEGEPVLQKETSTEQPDSSANFFARVLTGDSAYPVSGAKVILYRNGELYKVLTTAESGETIKTKIPAYQKQNSLEPLSGNQRLDYTADVYADSFITRKNLLVSAVGGSEIILTVQMTPVSERIE